ncbi:alanine racemase C-terminal domain-containing protein [Massilia agri]
MTYLPPEQHIRVVRTNAHCGRAGAIMSAGAWRFAAVVVVYADGWQGSLSGSEQAAFDGVIVPIMRRVSMDSMGST